MSSPPPTQPQPHLDTTAPIPASEAGPTDALPETEDSDPIARATVRKEEGTDHFRGGRWTEALVAYRAGLGCLPPRALPPPPAVPRRDDDPDDDFPRDTDTDTEAGRGKGKAEDAKGKGKAKETGADDVPIALSSPAVSEADKEVARLRAVLNANIGACLVKLGDHKDAAKVCSEAILDDPSYIKARERRAACNEIIGSWTSLTSAQEDYTALLALPIPAKQQAEMRRKLQLLKPRLEAAQKRETDEMLGKLKGLGNSLLGNFGLSTDNFKFEPNGTGGYSLNFQR